MATETEYTYTVATDIPSGLINAGRLNTEIKNSAISIALKSIVVTSGVCRVTFKDVLPAADKTILDGDTTAPAGGLIGAHTGAASTPTADLVQLSSPSEPDGKPVFVASPSTEGWMTWITSRGDDLAATPPASGRGDGTPIKVSFTAPGTQQVDINFLEPIELHDGQFSWDPNNWDCDDTFGLSVIIPATPTTVNGSNTGNCNLVPMTGYNVIVPAAGDGAYDVDLNVPRAVVPQAGGYWEVDHDSGLVTPSTTPGATPWHLLDVPVESFFLKNVSMSNPLGVFDIDVYKAEWLSQAWTLRLSVNRLSSGTGPYNCSGWLMMFREYST